MNRVAAPPWELFVSGKADSGLIDTTFLNDLELYTRVEPAGASFFTDSGIAFMQLEDPSSGGRFRFQEWRQPKAEFHPWPALPFRLSTIADIPANAQGRLIVGRDSAGDEDFRLYAYAPRSGYLRPWPMPQGRASSMVMSPGGRTFAYAFNPNGSRFWDIRRGFWNLASSNQDTVFQDTVLLREGGVWTPLDIDASGNEVLLAHTVSAFHSELYALSAGAQPLGSARASNLRRLPPLQNASTVSWAHWLQAPVQSGKSSKAKRQSLGSLALIADGPSEFARLYAWDAALGDSLRALSVPCDCDVEAAVVLPSSDKIAYALNRQGASALYLVDAKTRVNQAVQGLPIGVIIHLQPDDAGKRLLVTLSDFSTPGDVYIVDLSLAAQGKSAATLLREAPGKHLLPKPRYAIGAPRRIEVTPPDPLPPPQRRIPAWVVIPHTDSGVPLVLHIHGGPEMQARPGWDPFDRYMAEQWGVAFAYPDVRGSTGYGRAFQAADDQARRFKVVRDISCLFDSLRAWPDLDAKRAAILGRSYGGFVSQACAIDLWPRFSVALSQVGISDFKGFLAGTSGYRADLRRMEYGDERDSAQRIFLDSLSPLKRMDKLRIPLMLVHGVHDPRVPYAQSFWIYQALFNRDAPALFLSQNQEGHATRDPTARLAQMQLMAQFLIKGLHIPHR